MRFLSADGADAGAVVHQVRQARCHAAQPAPAGMDFADAKPAALLLVINMLLAIDLDKRQRGHALSAT